jgi:hypothetical protein
MSRPSIPVVPRLYGEEVASSSSSSSSYSKTAAGAASAIPPYRTPPARTRENTSPAVLAPGTPARHNDSSSP